VWSRYKSAFDQRCHATLNHIERRRRRRSASSVMTMQVPSFFSTMLPSTATSAIVQHTGNFDLPPSVPPHIFPPSSSVSVPPSSSSSFVAMSTITDAITTSGGAGRNLVVGDFYCTSSTASLVSRHSVAASDSYGSGVISGSGLHQLMPTYGVTTSRTAARTCFTPGMASYGCAAGLESLFGAGCGSSFTSALHHASATTPDVISEHAQQAGGHVIDSGDVAGGGSTDRTARSPHFGELRTTAAVTPVDSDRLSLYALSSQPDTLQHMIYRRSFTGAKPPYSYISLITMAIQVQVYTLDINRPCLV